MADPKYKYRHLNDSSLTYNGTSYCTPEEAMFFADLWSQAKEYCILCNNCHHFARIMSECLKEGSCHNKTGDRKLNDTDKEKLLREFGEKLSNRYTCLICYVKRSICNLKKSLEDGLRDLENIISESILKLLEIVEWLLVFLLLKNRLFQK